LIAILFLLLCFLTLSDCHFRLSATDILHTRQAAAMAAVDKMMTAKTTKTEPSAVSTINFGEYIKKVVSFLARNFFTMKFLALSIAFLINFMLLFYKVGGLNIHALIYSLIHNSH
jgi:hypothetical protein